MKDKKNNDEEKITRKNQCILKVWSIKTSVLNNSLNSHITQF